MKFLHTLSLIFAILISTTSCETGERSELTGLSDTFEQLETQFADPGRQYGSAPLWVWNTRIDSALISDMMAEFQEQGFGGVFIHPRPGLITEYLSEEWFALCGYTLQKGRELDLEVWIYDENSYPSGFAGGHVPAEMPESYNQGQMLHLDKFEVLPADAGDFFICLKQSGEDFVDVTARQDSERGKSGQYYCFSKETYRKSPWYGGFSYVDLLVPGVTEKFIELTMEGYEKAMGDAFGKTVPGVFTDEPNIEVQGQGNIRWTPDLFGVFEDTWGYDLRLHLPALFEETGEWNKVRHNYYQILLQMFIDRWSKPWFEYTERKGLEWTGHYWEHGWPNPNHGGDNMAMYAWHQRPAIDMLFNQFNEERANAQFGNIRAVKELSSVANQMGRRRTLSETYGGAGWELTFMDMKRLGDWEYVLGVNSLNQHLSFMTIKGARKYDYPQSFTYHSPWWPYYRELNRYYARLSLALSMGAEAGDILVIEPTTSAWMYAARSNPNARMAEIGQEFQTFVTTLEEAQVHYDLGSENIMKDHGAVEGSSLIVGKKAYRTVVIAPGTENLDAPTVQLLESYVRNGGKVIVFDTPGRIDGAPDDGVRTLLEGGDQIVYASELVETAIELHLLDGHAMFSEADGGNLYHMRRTFADGSLVFLANASMQDQHRGTLRIRGGDALVLDLFTGDILAYPHELDGAYISVDYTLYPAGSMLMYFPEARVSGYEPYVPEPKEMEQVPASETAVQRLRPNVLTIDFCDVQLGGNTLDDLHVYNAADTVYKHYGFEDGNPWNHSIQYRQMTVDRDTFSTHTGFSVRYQFEAEGDVDFSSLRVVAESPEVWTVKVNGKHVQSEPGEWWIEQGFAVYNIANQARRGDNTIELSTERMRIHAEVEPVYVLGNFNLEATSGGWKIVEHTPLGIGNWIEQGHPLYGFEVSYTKTFKADANRQYAVRLGEWEGTVAHVRVNGKEAGNIFAPPYILDISASLGPGNNTVEVVVVGSLKNTLGPHHGNPTPGLVSPWQWRNIKSPTPGDAYDLYPYGLVEDYEILGVMDQTI
jgi:hypothetical protein